MMRVTVLGCGGSGGVPQLDIGWGRCDPANPRNRRLRSSLLIETGCQDGQRGQAVFLIDTSPDLRQQLLAANVRRLDAIFYTHAHADHIHGLDDLRPVNRVMGGPIQIYADAATLRELHERFHYAFLGIKGDETVYRPWLIANTLGTLPLSVCDQKIVSFEQNHGWSVSQGYRIGDLAYTTDLVDLSEDAFRLLEGVKVWVIGCLSDKPYPTHAHVGLVLKWVERLKPQRTFLTHMGPSLDYETLKASLPQSVEPAYDGLTFMISEERGGFIPAEYGM